MNEKKELSRLKDWFRAIREFRGSRTVLADNSLKVQLRMWTEIDQYPKMKQREFEIVVKLSSMGVVKFRNGLQFQNDQVVAD